MPRPTRVTYILSNIDRAVEFEWIVDGLDGERFSLSFVLLNSGASHLESFLKSRGIPVIRVPYAGKSDIPRALFSTWCALSEFSSQVVHVHLFEASLIGLPAAWLAGIPHRIHTRHHADCNHLYHPHAIKYDRFINRMATRIVAISRNVWEILDTLEQVPAAKLRLIPHGFDLAAFENVDEARVVALRSKYGCDGRHPVVGVVSRYAAWKGIEHSLEAFRRLLKQEPNALLILANAQGPDAEEIRSRVRSLPKGSFIEIGFEFDHFALYRLFDIFVHVPIDPRCEAFGQTYIEALAAGVPSIFTLSGIAREFVRDRINALVVPFKDPDAIFAALCAVLTDDDLAGEIRRGGRASIERFSLDSMLRGLEGLYAAELAGER